MGDPQLTPEQTQALDTLEQALPRITDPEKRQRVLDRLRKYGRNPAVEAQRPLHGGTGMGDVKAAEREAQRPESQPGVPSFISYVPPGEPTDAERRADLMVAVDEGARADARAARMLTPAKELEHLITERDPGAPIDPSTGERPPANSLPVRATAAALRPMMAGVNGALVGLSGGLGVPAARALSNVASGPVSGGAVKHGYEETEQAAADYPLISLPAQLLTTMMPSSVPGRVAGPAARAALPAGGLAGAGLGTRMLLAGGSGAAGGAVAGGVSGVAAAADRLQQGAPAGEALAAIPEHVGGGATGGLALSPLMHGLVGLGGRMATGLRESPRLGQDVVRLERSGLTTRSSFPPVQAEAKPVETPRGAFGARKGSAGISQVAAPEGNAIAEAQRMQADPNNPRGGDSAADINTEKAARTALGKLSERGKEITTKQGRESAMYEASPEGQRMVSTEPLVEHVNATIKSGTGEWGKALPGSEGEVGAYAGALRGILRGRVVPGNDGISPAEASRLGIEVIGEAPEDGNYSVALEPLRVNAQQLEKSIRAYSTAAREYSKADPHGLAEPAKRTAAVLRSMRDAFGPNEVAPADRTAMLSTGKKVSGYPAMKQQQHEELDTFEQQLQAFGLPPNLAEVDPADVNSLKAAMGAIAKGDRILQELAPNDPELQSQLRVAAAHHAYDRLAGKAAGPRLVAGQGGLSAFASGATDTARLALDPLARRVGGYGLEPRAREALGGARAGTAASSGVPQKLLSRFLDSLGLGDKDKKKGQKK